MDGKDASPESPNRIARFVLRGESHDARATAALLAASHVERLDDDQVVRLVDRTEDWSAAIYLAALSLRGRAEPGAFVDDFTGTNRFVTDFLSEDVTDFLIHTCVLDEFTPSLCDAVAAVTDSGERLRWLEGSNLFVVPLDEHRHTYRYHRLFGQYLLTELVRREPGIVAELHRRAFEWYRGRPGRNRAPLVVVVHRPPTRTRRSARRRRLDLRLHG
jgi:LuxR family maltose regulon positive regulatory protein